MTVDHPSPGQRYRNVLSDNDVVSTAYDIERWGIAGNPDPGTANFVGVRVGIYLYDLACHQWTIDVRTDFRYLLYLEGPHGKTVRYLLRGQSAHIYII